MFEERNRFEIFTAAKWVRNPFAGLTRVVEIEHGSDGVHAETVHVVLIHPEESVRGQVILNFVSAVIENECAPIGVCAAARISVLVKVGTVEKSKAMRVARKMGGGPVQDYAEIFPVAAVNEVHEICGGTEPAGDSEIAEGLIAPGSLQRMLHDGPQFDVSVAHALDVGDQFIGEFAIGKPAIAIFWIAPPCARMDFIDGHRGMKPIARSASFEPRGIVPMILV